MKLITTFYQSSISSCIYVIVYVDDIVTIGNDHKGINLLKQHLSFHFQTKDLGKLQYFLRIKATQSHSSISICQRKYAFDIISETSTMESKLIDTSMHPNVKFLQN